MIKVRFVWCGLLMMGYNSNPALSLNKSRRPELGSDVYDLGIC